MRLAQASETAKLLKANVAQIEKQIEALLDRIVDSGNATVIAAYEKRITKLEREKVLAQEKLATNGKPRLTLEESFEHVLAFLSSPWNLWRDADLVGRKTVLRLTFLEPLAYCRNQGLRTPNLAFPFKALGGFYSGKCEMAHPTRFERVTSAFGGMEVMLGVQGTFSTLRIPGARLQDSQVEKAIEK